MVGNVPDGPISPAVCLSPGDAVWTRCLSLRHVAVRRRQHRRWDCRRMDGHLRAAVEYLAVDKQHHLGRRPVVIFIVCALINVGLLTLLTWWRWRRAAAKPPTQPSGKASSAATDGGV